jgi:anti-anti-sigma factor
MPASFPRPGDHGIAVLDIGDAVVVTITGELDMVNAPALNARLRDQLDRRPRGLILELDLGFCGSAGLQVVAEAATRTFDLDIPFAVATTSAPALRALEVGHLTEVVTVTGTVAQARQWILDQPGRS